ncbi:type II toxin-antitoxin system VapC family toxin [Sphingomonas sp. BK345]|uniref:type II toxin-antitoxin system VapC family toxin n=1 Tax=Sphingomonas sp. BK345 TaxID=2586980 RepID=UPI001614D86C|nr:type II toxin-antitoxin system VapC family toxin [Sphingomonas sp. BK345]MBB3473650.1 PIN domain nuclease of toxin-antitoxin system [Sphingomonas sp. BK345]
MSGGRTGASEIGRRRVGVLAYLLDEPGCELLANDDGAFLLSAVNLTEVLTKVTEHDLAPEMVLGILRHRPIELVEHGSDDAIRAARLRPLSRHLGLSLGDRVCLALGQRLALPVMTSDRRWADLNCDIDVRLIR